jgi:hypothetical protein
MRVASLLCSFVQPFAIRSTDPLPTAPFFHILIRMFARSSFHAGAAAAAARHTAQRAVHQQRSALTRALYSSVGATRTLTSTCTNQAATSLRASASIAGVASSSRSSILLASSLLISGGGPLVDAPLVDVAHRSSTTDGAPASSALSVLPGVAAPNASCGTMLMHISDEGP